MRHNPEQKLTSNKMTNTSVAKSRTRAQLRWLAALWSGVAAFSLASDVYGQTLAPIVRSAVSDPTWLSGNSDVMTLDNLATRSMVVPAGVNSPASQTSDRGLSLGSISDGNVIGINEGEDRVIETSDTIPQGYHTSTQMGGMDYSSPGYSGMQYGNNGGSYSGYAPYGSPVSNPCCPENCHDYYVSYESVFLKAKASQNFSLSQGRFLGRYDYDFGGRYTIGQMLDCVDGVEFVYTGPFEWNRSRDVQAATNSLQSILTASDGYVAADINAFNNSRLHAQAERIDLQSFEVNRRWFAWDIMSTLIGIRAFRYNESFLFDAFDQINITPTPADGFFRTRLENFLIGPQVGMDSFRPVGQRLSIGTSARIGIFANFNKGETFLSNRGNPLLNASRRDIDIAGAITSGGIGRYRVTPRLSVIGGYEAWILAGVATVSDQNYVPITPSTGINYRSQDIVFFHGATGGIEYKF
jgi:hypothetical protein